ncbi:MAG TPA: DUF3052 family protein [Longimicrobiales bacterium]|nr:DUF3052 family protein [Longimicrobiales bacterium]
MSPGYSGTPLVKKLGLKVGMRVLVQGCPLPYDELVRDLPEGIVLLARGSASVDAVHAFVRSASGLEAKLEKYRELVRPDGMIWISWPKRASGLATDLSEDVIRTSALKAGLVDVKVCAVDDTWSGLKLVIPIAKR